MSAHDPVTASGDGTRSSERRRSVAANSAEEAGRTPPAAETAATADDIFTAFRRYRLAARAIARDEALGSRRFPALSALVTRARAEFCDGSWEAVTIQRVIYSESWELLVLGVTPAAPSESWRAHPIISALWALRRRGRQDCPTCLRAVPAPAVLSKWEDADRALWVEAFLRESAVEPGGTAA